MSGDFFKIKGGNELVGRAEIHGAKNAVLPLMACGLLTEDEVIIENCPYISDVEAMIKILRALGAQAIREGRRIRVVGQVNRVGVEKSLCKDMRSSMFMLGALLATRGEAVMDFPGGCAIGLRPMDIHFDGLRKMGAQIEYTQTGVRCFANKLIGADIVMKYPSVGATENLLMCATLASGKTQLVNCAREPEIISLAQCLRAMGARIRGEGTSVIVVDGVDKLGGCTVMPIADRIVAGTIACAVALCGGDVEIDGANKNHLGALCDVLNGKNCKISGDENSMRVRALGRPRAMHVTTAPYPLFPTDLQPQILACACFADGVSLIKETVFESRFAHALELKRLGANVSIEKDVARVVGCNKIDDMSRLRAGEMHARDLRGGAGLMLVALKLRGESRVYGTNFIDRGYEKIEDMWCGMGAYVARTEKRIGV